MVVKFCGLCSVFGEFFEWIIVEKCINTGVILFLLVNGVESVRLLKLLDVINLLCVLVFLVCIICLGICFLVKCCNFWIRWIFCSNILLCLFVVMEFWLLLIGVLLFCVRVCVCMDIVIKFIEIIKKFFDICMVVF